MLCAVLSSLDQNGISFLPSCQSHLDSLHKPEKRGQAKKTARIALNVFWQVSKFFLEISGCDFKLQNTLAFEQLAQVFVICHQN